MGVETTTALRSTGGVGWLTDSGPKGRHRRRVEGRAGRRVDDSFKWLRLVPLLPARVLVTGQTPPAAKVRKRIKFTPKFNGS